MKKRLFILTAILAILILATSSIAVAAGATTETVDGQITILELVPGLEVYDDAEATTPTASLDFPDAKPGQSANVTVYVKNTGDLNFTNVDVQMWSMPGQTALTWADVDLSVDNFPLSIGSVQELTVTLTIHAGEAARDQGVQLKLVGTY